MTARVPEESNKGPETRRGSAAFPAGARLLRHADFERVYKQGRRHFAASMTVFYLQRRPEAASGRRNASGLRIGFTVGRVLGGAVQRNRMKRRLREAVRLSKPWPAADVDVVINPKKVLLTLQFDTLLNEVRQAFVAIEKKLAKSGGAAESERTSGRRPEA
ncbi:MAG: ribonuclease P protein component [Candidatus Sulfotelmatobacter sp.]